MIKIENNIWKSGSDLRRIFFASSTRYSHIIGFALQMPIPISKSPIANNT